MTLFPLTPVMTRLQKFCSFSDPHPLLQAMNRVVFDPHQSPIRFKAWTPKHPAPPLVHSDPRNTSVPCRCQLFVTDHVVLNQPLAGYRHRRIKSRNRKRVPPLPIRPDGFAPTPRPVNGSTQINYPNSLDPS